MAGAAVAAGMGGTPAPRPGAERAAAERSGHAHGREHDELHHREGEAAAHRLRRDDEQERGTEAQEKEREKRVWVADKRTPP